MDYISLEFDNCRVLFASLPGLLQEYLVGSEENIATYHVPVTLPLEESFDMISLSEYESHQSMIVIQVFWDETLQEHGLYLSYQGFVCEGYYLNGSPVNGWDSVFLPKLIIQLLQKPAGYREIFQNNEKMIRLFSGFPIEFPLIDVPMPNFYSPE